MTRRYFHEYRFADHQRTDFSRLAECECGADMLAWIKEHYGNILTHPTIPSLEAAMKAIRSESQERLRAAPKHPFNRCIEPVTAEVLEILTTKRADLQRQPTGAHAA